jgi:hypothetical protein
MSMPAALGAPGPQMLVLQLDLFRDGEGVIYFDPEIANRALQLRVGEQQLHRPQIAGLLLDLCRLRPAQRMCAVRGAIEAGTLHPSMDDAGVLPRREMRLRLEAAREKISTTPGVEHGQPVSDGGADLLRDLELHRPAGLLLDYRRSIANSPAGEHIIDPQPDEVAAPELAVYRQIEHREIALAPLQL